MRRKKDELQCYLKNTYLLKHPNYTFRVVGLCHQLQHWKDNSSLQESVYSDSFFKVIMKPKKAPPSKKKELDTITKSFSNRTKYYLVQIYFVFTPGTMGQFVKIVLH